MQFERALIASTSADQRALTASMASHFGEVAARRDERRGRFFFAEYQRTESVRREYRGSAPRRARRTLGIDDSPRGASTEFHSEL